MRQARGGVRRTPAAGAGGPTVAAGRARRALPPGRAAHAMEHELAMALRRGQFALVYQPIRGMRGSGAPVFEALLRWHHPELGDVEPGVFIPIAERNGLIMELGDWVFRSAAAQCLRLRRLSAQPVRIAVNVSAEQLASRPATQLWLRYIERIGLPAEALTLEVTERVMSQRPDLVRDHLAQLGRAGLRIALDDFGTGYSNLSMLGHVHVDEIKLDASLIRCLPDSARHRTITASIVALAHDLRIGVVAEGVEGATSARIAGEIGCDFAQGYWYDRPLSVAQVERRLCGIAG